MTEELRKPVLGLVGEPKPEINPTDVFNDLSALRKQSKLVVKRKTAVINVAVEKPPNNVYFRTHPSEDMILDDATVLRDEKGSYFYVVPDMRSHPKLEQRLRKVTLRLTYLWPTDVLMIWPVPILGGRDFPVWKSVRAASKLAETNWTQIVWNEDRRDYDVETAEGLNIEPRWSDKTLGELLKVAFAGRIIDSEDHEYALRLRGLID